MNTRRNLENHSPKTIASFPEYQRAEEAIDKLADSGFPVQYTSIVADGLQLVEKVTGRLNWFRSTSIGLLNGIFVGAIIGFLFGIFDIMTPIQSGFLVAGYGAGFGAIVGAILGLAGYLLTNSRRDFDSHTSFKAKYYDIIVDEQYAHRALKILEESFSDLMPPKLERDKNLEREFAVPAANLNQLEQPITH